MPFCVSFVFFSPTLFYFSSSCSCSPVPHSCGLPASSDRFLTRCLLCSRLVDDSVVALLVESIRRQTPRCCLVAASCCIEGVDLGSLGP
uniref:Putative secreted protein n=1 Tax=Anopheles darlingi TaxID=43151 RepID=A0A2M4D6Z1_ANODA